MVVLIINDIITHEIWGACYKISSFSLSFGKKMGLVYCNCYLFY